MASDKAMKAAEEASERLRKHMKIVRSVKAFAKDDSMSLANRWELLGDLRAHVVRYRQEILDKIDGELDA